MDPREVVKNGVSGVTAGRPRVLQLLHSLDVGGAEVLAARLARKLRDRFDFSFACLDGLGALGERLKDEGFPVEVIHRGTGIDLMAMRRLRLHWRKHHADIIQAHQYTPFFYATAGRQWRTKPPILFTEHGRFWPDEPSRKRMVFNRLMLGRADRVVAVGASVRRALVENEGILGERISVIYNGVEIDRFAPRDDVRRRVRDELALRDDTFAVIHVARLDPIKDHQTALSAFRAARSRGVDMKLVIVGDGPQRASIEQSIAEQDLKDAVLMLGTRHDVPDLLAASDAFLLTSRSEGIPVTVIEAMAARLPVVATDVGGLPEVVLADETGLLCPAGDADALGGALERLAGDVELRATMGERGRDRASELFSETAMHEAYAELYGVMVRGSSRRS